MFTEEARDDRLINALEQTHEVVEDRPYNGEQWQQETETVRAKESDKTLKQKETSISENRNEDEDVKCSDGSKLETEDRTCAEEEQKRKAEEEQFRAEERNRQEEEKLFVLAQLKQMTEDVAMIQMSEDGQYVGKQVATESEWALTEGEIEPQREEEDIYCDNREMRQLADETLEDEKELDNTEMSIGGESDEGKHGKKEASAPVADRRSKNGNKLTESEEVETIRGGYGEVIVMDGERKLHNEEETTSVKEEVERNKDEGFEEEAKREEEKTLDDKTLGGDEELAITTQLRQKENDRHDYAKMDERKSEARDLETGGTRVEEGEEAKLEEERRCEAGGIQWERKTKGKKRKAKEEKVKLAEECKRKINETVEKHMDEQKTEIMSQEEAQSKISSSARTEGVVVEGFDIVDFERGADVFESPKQKNLTDVLEEEMEEPDFEDEEFNRKKYESRKQKEKKHSEKSDAASMNMSDSRGMEFAALSNAQITGLPSDDSDVPADKVYFKTFEADSVKEATTLAKGQLGEETIEKRKDQGNADEALGPLATVDVPVKLKKRARDKVKRSKDIPATIPFEFEKLQCTDLSTPIIEGSNVELVARFPTFGLDYDENDFQWLVDGKAVNPNQGHVSLVIPNIQPEHEGIYTLPRTAPEVALASVSVSNIDLRWKPIQSDEGVTYIVELSKDGGKWWKPIITSLRETHASISEELASPLEPVQLRVVGENEFGTGPASTPPVRIPARACIPTMPQNQCTDWNGDGGDLECGKPLQMT
ncbi:hypothetical protein X801_00675 [Opisthorchis viverrini]|uniref:Fibronectin type-III domain-containing protein n=1 Tax=Opisthorchis viverrini TaxID=6198 RepID=A0A1S8X9K9_OPIVI|nr:hypothetical protein X801_00675 [Opisthorchis viverrini]